MTFTSCTDEVRVKVPSFQKVTLFLQCKIFNRDGIRLHFCLFEDVNDFRNLKESGSKKLCFNRNSHSPLILLHDVRLALVDIQSLG